MLGLARIFKANPYKDAKGRFTTADGAVSTVTMAKDMEKQMQFLSDRAKQHGVQNIDQFFMDHPNLAGAYAKEWRRYHAYKGDGNGFGFVFKFNPYHDAKGLFTSGDGGAGPKMDIKAGNLSKVLSDMRSNADQHPNILGMKVGGNKIFGNGQSLGITRIDMPQIPSKMRDEFLKGLHVQVVRQKLDPTTLKPTQDQLDGYKVGKLYHDLTHGKYDGAKPIIVSQDNYIIDGHHHWGAKVAMYQSDPSTTIEADVVHMSHANLLAAAHAFDAQHGIVGKDITKSDKYAHIFKYSPDQPRDENGRWTDGSGSGATNGTGTKDVSLADVYTKNDHAVTPQDILSKLSPEIQKEIKLATARASTLPQTQNEYSKIVDGQRIYTPERQALHNQIVDKFTSEKAIQKALPAQGEKPTLVILGGRGGSGKSAFTNGKINEFDASKFVTIDPDAIKSMLPEYKGWNAAQVHEESSDIGHTIRAVLLARGANIILDTTLASKSALSMIEQAKAHGYNVEGHYMYLSREDAATRAISRYEGNGPSSRGRLVPPDVILSNKTNESNFDSMKPLFDRWSAYDNTGKAPVKIAGSSSKPSNQGSEHAS